MNRNIQPVNPTVIIARCPICSSDWRLAPSDVVLDEPTGVYRFDCQSCGSVSRPVNHRLVCVLRAAGVLEVNAISEAEVDRFVQWLDSVDCLVEWL